MPLEAFPPLLLLPPPHQLLDRHDPEPGLAQLEPLEELEELEELEGRLLLPLLRPNDELDRLEDEPDEERDEEELLLLLPPELRLPPPLLRPPPEEPRGI